VVRGARTRVESRRRVHLFGLQCKLGARRPGLKRWQHELAIESSDSAHRCFAGLKGLENQEQCLAHASYI